MINMQQADEHWNATFPWAYFGTHAGPDFCDYTGRLLFGPDAEDGLPDLERHADGSRCPAAHPEGSDQHPQVVLVDGDETPPRAGP